MTIGSDDDYRKGDRFVMYRKITLAAACCMVLAGAGGLVQAKTAKIPAIHWKGTINFYAQSLTPVGPGIKQVSGERPLHALYDLSVQFNHLYPNVHIHFVNPAYNSSNQAVIANAAAGTLKDMMWNQYENYDFVFPQGIAYNLMPYFRQPNPYIPGNKHWIGVMNPSIVKETLAPGGQAYVVDGDWLAVNFFYNKTLFKKAGITTTPKTWAQLLQDCKRLKAHGITPGADRPSYDWWSRVFLGNYLGVPTLKKISSFSKSPGISEFDNAIAYYKGIINPQKNPRIMAWWPAMRQLYHYWNPNTTALPVNGSVPAGAPTGESLFAAGKVAMVFQGSWTPNAVKYTKGHAKFAVGSFPVPSLTGTSKYATKYNSSGDAGGPQAAFQFAISTPQADHAMNAGKFQAALDFLRFISTPQHDQMIVNEMGNMMPTFKGTTPIKAFRPLQTAMTKPWYQEDGGQYMTAEEYATIRSIFAEYVGGHISLKAAASQYSKAVATGFHQFVLAHHVNLAKY